MAAWSQLVEGQIDFAAVDYSSLAGAPGYSSDAFVVLPHAGVALAVAYSFCDAAAADPCVLANQTLTLAAAELAAVLDGNVTLWLDPRIVSLNPWMGVQPFASAIGASREIGLVGEAGTADTTRLTAELLRQLTPSVGLAAFDEASGRASIELTAQGVAARVASTPFSLGMVPLLSLRAQSRVASLMAPADASLIVAPSADSLDACAGDAAGWGSSGEAPYVLHTRAAVEPACYPLTATVVLVTPRRHSAANCTRGQQAVEFLEWVSGSAVERAVLSDRLLPLAVRAAALVAAALANVLCDNASYSELLAGQTALGVGLKLLVILPGAALILFFGVACGVLATYREKTTVKAAQPTFFFLMAAGCTLSILATMLAVTDHAGLDPAADGAAGQSVVYPSLDAACGAQVCCFFIGASLTHGALVAKLWRIKKIMINPTLREVRVPLRVFVGVVAVSVVVDAVALAVWMGVAPPYYRLELFVHGTDGGVETWRGACQVLPDGSEAPAAFLMTKQSLVVAFGLYLCLAARDVPQRYSDVAVTTFLLAGHLERTVCALLVGGLLFPIADYGSATVCFLLQWCVQTAAVLGVAVALFGGRLSMLSRELAESHPELGRSPQLPGAVPATKTRLSFHSNSVLAEAVHHKGTPLARVRPHQSVNRTSGHENADGESKVVVPVMGRRSSAHAAPGEGAHASGLAGALAKLQAEHEATVEELGEARDEMTELREKNHNLIAQLEVVREERDKLFFAHVMAEDA
jgi:ABC-type phosphate transport system substrate-binding protein